MRRLVEFLLARTPRERRLLGGLVVFAVPLAVIFGVLLPMQAQLETARREEVEAAVLHLWVAERAAAAGASAPAAPRAARPPIGSSGLEQGLISAGLRGDVTDLGVRDDGVIELRFEQVDFTVLANWISAARPEWGYDISSFRFEARDVSGAVSATLSLAPQG